MNLIDAVNKIMLPDTCWDEYLHAYVEYDASVE
jgi:hypothetical protein